MVYQIYYGDERPRKVLFDIEYYLIQSDTDKNKWMVELHSTPVLSDSVRFVRDILRPELVDDFIKDCAELEDLRGWIWERHMNLPRSMEDASESKKKWGKYIEGRIKYFCEKYGLHLNID